MKTDIKFCGGCGHELLESVEKAPYCYFCGKQLPDITKVSVPEKKQEAPVAESKKSSKPDKKLMTKVAREKADRKEKTLHPKQVVKNAVKKYAADAPISLTELSKKFNISAEERDTALNTLEAEGKIFVEYKHRGDGVKPGKGTRMIFFVED